MLLFKYTIGIFILFKFNNIDDITVIICVFLPIKFLMLPLQDYYK